MIYGSIEPNDVCLWVEFWEKLDWAEARRGNVWSGKQRAFFLI